MNNLRLICTGGGTGGHLFPAIAAAEEFQRRYPGTEVLFIGTERKLDSESLARYRFACKTIPSAGIKGKNPLQLLWACFQIPRGYFQALRILREFQPNIVLAVGGYVTAPVVAAAKKRGAAVVLHEQNSIAGLANRKLAGLADKVCLSLPDSTAGFDKKKIVQTGNPVRKSILDSVKAEKQKESEKRITILVLGGSQGAHRLNILLPEAFAQAAKQAKKALKIVHQTGKSDVELVRSVYAEKKIDADVSAFIEDMAKAYHDADFVVSRAGATTLAELAVVGKPAILIPYPYAADNHQQKNGEYYVDGGGAVQYVESEITADTLARKIVELADDGVLREEMSDAMRNCAFPDAAERIVDVCISTVKRKG